MLSGEEGICAVVVFSVWCLKMVDEGRLCGQEDASSLYTADSGTKHGFVDGRVGLTPATGLVN